MRYLHVLMPVEAFHLMARGCRVSNDSRRPSSAVRPKLNMSPNLGVEIIDLLISAVI